MGKHLKKLSMAFAVVFSLSTVFSANVTSAKAADSEIALMAETVCTTVEEAAERLREGREALEKEVRIQIKFKEGEWEKYGYKDYKDCWRIVSDLAMGEDGTGVEDQYIANITKRRSYSIDNYSSVNNCTLVYGFEYRISKEQHEEFMKKEKEVLKSLKLDGLSEFEKIQKVYDYITANVTYDHNMTKGDLTYTAYSALINNTSVCAGYANLFYKMATDAGLDARYIANSTHAWNIVRVGDKWYNVDATWDAGKNPNAYYYFLISDDGFLDSDHGRLDEYKTDAYNKKYPTSKSNYLATPYKSRSLAVAGMRKNLENGVVDISIPMNAGITLDYQLAKEIWEEALTGSLKDEVLLVDYKIVLSGGSDGKLGCIYYKAAYKNGGNTTAPGGDTQNPVVIVEDATKITTEIEPVETSGIPVQETTEATTEATKATTEATTKAITEATTKATTEATNKVTTKATTEGTANSYSDDDSYDNDDYNNYSNFDWDKYFENGLEDNSDDEWDSSWNYNDDDSDNNDSDDDNDWGFSWNYNDNDSDDSDWGFSWNNNDDQWNDSSWDNTWDTSDNGYNYYSNDDDDDYSSFWSKRTVKRSTNTFTIKQPTPTPEVKKKTTRAGVKTTVTRGIVKNSASNGVYTVETLKTEKDNTFKSDVVEFQILNGEDTSFLVEGKINKDEKGNIISSYADIYLTSDEKNGTINVSVPGTLVKQIKEVAGENVQLKIHANDKDGVEQYVAAVHGTDLIKGTTLKPFYASNNSDTVTMYGTRTFKVSKDGSLTVRLDSLIVKNSFGGSGKEEIYLLLNTTETKTAEKEIKAAIKLKKSSTSISKGKTYTVKMASTTDQDNIKSITYKSSNKTVATVTSKGKIKGKSKGTATIKVTVKMKNNKTKTLTFKVTVK
jgi:hypothetical protein